MEARFYFYSSCLFIFYFYFFVYLINLSWEQPSGSSERSTGTVASAHHRLVLLGAGSTLWCMSKGPLNSYFIFILFLFLFIINM